MSARATGGRTRTGPSPTPSQSHTQPAAAIERTVTQRSSPPRHAHCSSSFLNLSRRPWISFSMLLTTFSSSVFASAWDMLQCSCCASAECQPARLWAAAGTLPRSLARWKCGGGAGGSTLDTLQRLPIGQRTAKKTHYWTEGCAFNSAPCIPAQVHDYFGKDHTAGPVRRAVTCAPSPSPHISIPWSRTRAHWAPPPPPRPSCPCPLFRWRSCPRPRARMIWWQMRTRHPRRHPATSRKQCPPLQRGRAALKRRRGRHARRRRNKPKGSRGPRKRRQKKKSSKSAGTTALGRVLGAPLTCMVCAQRMRTWRTFWRNGLPGRTWWTATSSEVRL